MLYDASWEALLCYYFSPSRVILSKKYEISPIVSPLPDKKRAQVFSISAKQCTP